MTESFWLIPDNLGQVKTPAAILTEQANELAKLTRGLLVGRVQQVSSQPGNFAYDLYIVAPALNNYSYAVVRINHGISLYPVAMAWHAKNQMFQCHDEESYVAKLREVLSSQETAKVIAGLLAQANALQSEQK